jgi:hypothetical protein
MATVEATDKVTVSESRPIDIRVQREGFGASVADINAVLQSAAGSFGAIAQSFAFRVSMCITGLIIPKPTQKLPLKAGSPLV